MVSSPITDPHSIETLSCWYMLWTLQRKRFYNFPSLFIDDRVFVLLILEYEVRLLGILTRKIMWVIGLLYHFIIVIKIL